MTSNVSLYFNCQDINIVWDTIHTFITIMKENSKDSKSGKRPERKFERPSDTRSERFRPWGPKMLDERQGNDDKHGYGSHTILEKFQECLP